MDGYAALPAGTQQESPRKVDTYAGNPVGLTVSQSSSVDYPYSRSQSASFSRRPTMRRRWRMWPGRNAFCCGGRVMFGNASDVKYLCLSNVLILAPVVVFLGFKTYPHGNMIHAYNVPGLNSSIYPTALLFFAFLCESCLWRAALLDPGIILRQPVRTLAGQGDDSSLPKGWSRHFDKKEGQPYFYNHETEVRSTACI